MPLIRNSLVFLDTGFFKSHKTTDNVYRDFLLYSKDRKVRLCTSEMCLKEWHSQKVEQLESYFRTSQEKYSYLRRDSIVADEILSRYPGQYPDSEEIKKIAGEVIEQFVKEHEIQVYPATEEHIDRTFGAYFNGDPPYRGRKKKDDIPDSWVFEAAKDARFDQEHKSLQNRFCIGADKGLNEHLEQLGLRPINKSDLLDLLQREEQQLVGGGPEIQATSVKRKEPETVTPAAPSEDSLEIVLSTAISTELREIYIRVLGYTYWMSGPAKEDLIEMLEAKGFPRQLIEASVAILSQPSLKLITDTGNHILPTNKVVCEQAANLTMDEIVEVLR